ncbi:Programmed cell death protein 4 [Hypsibius exemplaris]|uniref:Programmed cell death protein 4 n=1 Tax=Hypsibius exemplaris TaxID=2072580 RepID=A0A1W0X9C4_HYPEX|nr:Programmed cell death protein 4 [Hypsibius exemplaris]
MSSHAIHQAGNRSGGANSAAAGTAKQKSAEETEVDELIQQLSTSETPEVQPGAAAEAAAKVNAAQPKHGKRHLVGKVAGAAASHNPKKDAAVTKNSRKPRNGTGRGLAKKGGAGGKGVWGKIGDEMDDYEEDEEAEDEPNDYDKTQAQKEEITKIDQLRAALAPILNEFYNHGKTAEVVRFLESISIKPALVPMIAYIAVDHSLDKKASERELTSTLLAELYDVLLSEEQFEEAVDELLKNLADLQRDCPTALEIVANYTARLIADDCLAPKFLEVRREKLAAQGDAKDALAALAKAAVLVNMNHGLVRLDNVWGVSGGIRPVKHLIKKMNQILKEYVASSGDVMEALRCLRELQVPHFHHEFVYEALLEVMENGSERAFDLLLKLLKEAANESILTVDQINTGFQRVYDDLVDIVLDVPSAYTATEKFATQCQLQGIIGQDLLKKFPQRGRKRYASENDGGRLKEEVDDELEKFRERAASNAAHIEEDEEDD